ncbi:UDP-glucose 4-epimerase GalE [Psychrosphaera sp. F3M07]|uniref:UDP-glucose 4-epimerase GalE n=1 Tax=Psychrosphaera sp. F3M07 TaxID=2841560 RepID=UPI001C08BEA6|nr:UDP-glucose 4-epimerase GalE [Psychrosphaera sp. F3M07]MBU2917749.1 UDP-glucose 4-epimerase GalE [Psychrosphaera sp. F3M07]
MKILVTGGAGFIGSHTVVELLNSGFEVVIADDLSNSSIEALERVKKITGKDFDYYQLDIGKSDSVRSLLNEHTDIQAVIHFAAFKAVGESSQNPLKYYKNNVANTIILLEELKRAGIYQFVFSSSATVYGDPNAVPITEGFPTGATNPYGQSKLTVEEILTDLAKSEHKWSISILRYFNPIGAHESGLIGEDPNGIPDNLLPYVSQVAVGKLDKLRVFGEDYDTPDGTGIRDYIHVVDLAKGHIKALVNQSKKHGCFTYNLGTGKGYSVFSIIKEFEVVSGKKIPYKVVDRRPGDIAECWANASLAKVELGWEAEYDLNRMLEDTWRWQSKNPNGYE